MLKKPSFHAFHDRADEETPPPNLVYCCSLDEPINDRQVHIAKDQAIQEQVLENYELELIGIQPEWQQAFYGTRRNNSNFQIREALNVSTHS